MSNQNSKEPRITLQSIKVLKVFIEHSNKKHSGADILKKTELATGTLYPILQRFEDAGWLKSEWEEIDPSEKGRPRKRYYNLTVQGKKKADKVLADIRMCF